MRDALRTSLLELCSRDDFVLLTGDLGYALLEPVQAALGERFVNAGVAEQNMVGVAAGMAKAGLFPWVYSIGPFIYARAFEQVRNDVAHHGLPVVLVGNGGGYGYGVMGSTHHSLEDYGVLATLRGFTVVIPAFASDVPLATAGLAAARRPAYLRLGRCERPRDFTPPPFAPWRRLLDGERGALVTVGPLAGGLVAELSAAPVAERPALWVVGSLPFSADEIPAELLAAVAGERLTVVEEHVAQGGLGSLLALRLLELGRSPARFVHRPARGYPSGRFGSQGFHRRESGLDAAAVLAAHAGDTP